MSPDPFEIPPDELVIRASRAGGPGGQHVNTSSTRIEVRWKVSASRALSEEQRARVLQKLANRVDGDGWIRVVASHRRSQLQNREAAIERLQALIVAASKVPKRRRPTKVPRQEKERRLSAKRLRGAIKETRRRPADD